eukprot:COSAG02_NODE_7470_length_2998_cov_1.583305_3_plen_153_part_01
MLFREDGSIKAIVLTFATTHLCSLSHHERLSYVHKWCASICIPQKNSVLPQATAAAGLRSVMVSSIHFRSGTRIFVQHGCVRFSWSSRCSNGTAYPSAACFSPGDSRSHSLYQCAGMTQNSPWDLWCAWSRYDMLCVWWIPSISTKCTPVIMR